MKTSSREGLLCRSSIIGLLISVCLIATVGGVSGCGLTGPYVRQGIAQTIPSVPSSLIERSIFLIGDAGAPSLEGPEPTLLALEHDAQQNHERNLIVFLGDNIYPAGMPDTGSAERHTAEKKLDVQIEAVLQSGAHGIFIPGNHDWDRWGDDGWDCIKRQASYIAAKNDPRIMFFPADGDPGPVGFPFGDDVLVVILDTQWWLQHGPKPLYHGQGSVEATEEAVIDSLRRILQVSGGRKVLVVGHHPLDTHGEHGGFFDWRDHLFPLRHVSPLLWIPLPVIGSAYPLARMMGITNQDLSGSEYAGMVQRLTQVFEEHPPVAYAAGHEHSLQVLVGPGRFPILVSGFGMEEHDTPLSPGDNTIFAQEHPGYMRIDVLTDGRMRLSVKNPVNAGGESREIFAMWLHTGS